MVTPIAGKEQLMIRPFPLMAKTGLAHLRVTEPSAMADFIIPSFIAMAFMVTPDILSVNGSV